MIKVILTILVFLCYNANAKEADFVNEHCPKLKGFVEVELPNKTRVDCLTSTHAIEYDFAKKWYEAIGQSLYYATLIKNHRPGIVLIVTKEQDYKYVERAHNTINYYGLPITLLVLRGYKDD